jgi:diacylglycerol kinase
MNMVSLRRMLKSFAHAGQGLVYVFKSEQNFRIQVAAGFVVLALALLFPLKNWEVILVVLLILIVWLIEILNTAFEYFSDLFKPRLHHYVHMVKDIMAGAVLLTSVVALIIGVIIFWPHFMNLFI